MTGPSIKTTLPGPKARAIIERDAAFVSPSYTRDYPLVIARGEGAIVEDVDGNTFLDCAAGIAVNSTGVSHPDVVKAIAEQAARFIHMSGTDFYYEPQVRLAEELASLVPIAGGVRSFFGNSGTEATEASIKLARYYTKRPNVIGFLGSFHGRSLGALALTSSKSVQRRGFGPLMPGVYHAPYPDQYRFKGSPDACAEASLSFIRDQILVHLTAPDEVAAVVVEPIQGEGGYVVPPRAFLQGLRELTAQHGMLLVLDEVQSGMGRTGRMFAAEHFDVTGDIVNIAKGIASGLPLGVTCARKDVMSWPPGAHASTFGGNPVACAAALAVIDTIERDGLLDHVTKVGEVLARGCAAVDHPLLVDVRGSGLWRGLVLSEPVAPAVEQAARAAGFLVNAAVPEAIRLAPPLILSEEEATRFCAALPSLLDAARVQA